MTEMSKTHHLSGDTLDRFLRFCAENDIEDRELSSLMEEGDKLPLLLARIRCKAGLPDETVNRLRRPV